MLPGFVVCYHSISVGWFLLYNVATPASEKRESPLCDPPFPPRSPVHTIPPPNSSSQSPAESVI